MLAALGMVAVIAGCASDPALPRDAERALRRSIADAAARELADARDRAEEMVTTREDGVPRLKLRQDILDELNKMAGPGSYTEAAPELGVDLMGQGARTSGVGLREAIRTATANNLALQFARLTPAATRAQVLAAEAAFDWTLFSNLNWNNTDSPRTGTSFSGGSFTPSVDVSRGLQGTVGLRKQLVGGGRFTVQTEASTTDSNTPGQQSRPNPAEQASVTVQWDQPLLRNAGSEVARAEIRVTRNAERASIQQLRQELITTVTDTERAYWNLVRAQQDLRILQRLLERGEQTRRLVEERRLIDANQSQIADTTARVERRRADVLRAQTQVRILSDQLKAFMNDPALPVGSEVVVLPADVAVDEPVKFSLIDCLSKAVQNRPEVQQAILSIDDASIRAIVADSNRLPDLTLRLQARFAGLDNNLDEAYADILSGKFADYLVGLAFELPLGNRRNEAEFRRRSIERVQSVISYRNTVQRVVAESKSALNRLKLNYELVGQTRVSRVTATDALRVQEVEKAQGLGFTVERLNLELNNQEQLAAAEQAEVDALIEYNIAIADLFAAMGTALERNGIDFVAPAE
jgi:outer membrane protein TolC